MTKKLPVVVGIPNYNMAQSLKALLDQLIQDNYDGIYVLDDESSDNSKEVVESYGDKVTFVGADRNLGAGGARNRILTVLKEPSVIHFLDADVNIISEDNADIIRTMNINDQVGFIGGTVLGPNNKQSIWNYGPVLSLYNTLSALLYVIAVSADVLFQTKLSSSKVFFDRPLYRQRTKKRVGWVGEGNMIIRSDTLKKFGGFDEEFREHDIAPLSFIARKNAMECYYDPSIIVLHKNIKIRGYPRLLKATTTEFRLIKKYGLWRWLTNGK